MTAGTSVAAPVAPVAARRAKHLRQIGWALFFLGPNLLLFLAFTAFPILFGFGISFFDWNIIEPPRFAGVENYQRFFLKDPLTAKVVSNSLYYVLGALPTSIVLPLCLAVLLNQRLPGTGFLRSIYFLPLVTSGVATAVVFKWIYAFQFGPLNQFVGLFGIAKQDGMIGSGLFQTH